MTGQVYFLHGQVGLLVLTFQLVPFPLHINLVEIGMPEELYHLIPEDLYSPHIYLTNLAAISPVILRALWAGI